MNRRVLELFSRLVVLKLRISPSLSTVIAFFTTYFELDPFFFMFEAFLPSQVFQNHSFTIAVVRFILSTVGNYEFFWVVSFVYVVVLGLVDLIHTQVGKLARGEISFGMTLRVYAMVHLVLRSTQRLCDLAITAFLAGLMGAAIIALYLYLSSYNLVPIAMFWVFPCIAIGAISFLQILVIPFIYMCEVSTEAILKLRIEPVNVPQFEVGNPSKLRKLARRKINALRPFTFYAGLFDYRFYELGKGIKIGIIDNIPGFTITALLA